uniref:Ig-like domain-containing protein n=1 Tax=Varanus komodoensis TaxID=61221 RepID=A0A8D2JEL1_VARKO
MAVVFVGDLPIARYDSNSRKVWYEAKWMEKLLEVHHEYQRKYEEMLQRDGADFTAGLRAVQATHNQSAGSHTWQMRAGCEVGPDRRKGQYLQFGYDGRDFLSLEVETSHWMAADATAQVIQRSWEESQYITTRFKSYVGETCSQWLRAERDQVREGSQRRAPPLMKVTRRAAYENLEIFVCRAYGFYPREIYMRWTIDGEAWEEDSFRWVLGPNSDGTYYARLDIRVDTWNRQHVRCHVQHSLLQGPQDLVLEEPGGSPRSVFRTTYTAVSEPGPGLPQFTAAAYVDDLPIARYDSNTRALQSQTSWVKKMLELHPEYQVNYTQQLQQDEADFIAGLRAVQATHNQSAGERRVEGLKGVLAGDPLPPAFLASTERLGGDEQ